MNRLIQSRNFPSEFMHDHVRCPVVYVKMFCVLGSRFLGLSKFFRGVRRLERVQNSTPLLFIQQLELLERGVRVLGVQKPKFYQDFYD